MKINTTGLIAVLLVIPVIGCHSLPFQNPFLKQEIVLDIGPIEPRCQIYTSPEFNSYWPQRVILIQSGRGIGRYDAQGLAIEELASQFRGNGLFDVVAPIGSRLHGHPDNVLNGKFEEREIAEISRTFNGDTVALVRINELRGHHPLRVSMTVAFIDSHETTLTCSVDGVWDLGRPQTKASFLEFVSRCSPNATNEANQIHLHSINSLLKFAAYEIAETIGSQ